MRSCYLFAAKLAMCQVHFRATDNKHPLGLGRAKKGKEWSMPHDIWTEDEVNAIQVSPTSYARKTV